MDATRNPMRSFSLTHFPQIRHRSGERMLWNPLLRKAFRNLPEERVRLRTLEFLLHDTEWPPTRISCETAIRDAAADTNPVRADMICYDRKYKPAIIIECKAPEIRLTEKTACQIAGYNRNIKAPYLLLTNGVSDLFFELDAQSGQAVPVSPESLFDITVSFPSKRSLSYYLDRGFAGEKTSPQVRSWLTQALPAFWDPEFDLSEIRFLDMGNTPDVEPVSHYYRIFALNDQKKLALTFLSSRYGDTRMVAILNKGGINTSMLEINLESMQQKKSSSAVLYHSGGNENINVSDLIDFTTCRKDQLRSLPESIDEIVSKI